MEAFASPQAIFNAVIVFCGGIVTFASALTIVLKAVGKAREPGKQQDARIAALEEQVTAIESRLQLGNRRFETDTNRVDRLEQTMRETDKIIVEGLQALTSHAIDGNNIQELKEAKRSLDEYLINKL